jgi:hypothetical protein
MSNTAIWDVLSKTDPAHTKGFSRSGGFKGTAIKPQWVVSRLTEHFGPVGVGWGMGEPSFQVINADKETLVYCTVSAWHTDRDNVFWGVGGDKVMTQRQSGSFVDDEAFKKAFTDALMNAFKFVGVAADVHMGLFDDSKYVQEMRDTFNPRQPSKQEETHGPDWPNLVDPSSITSNAAKKDESLVEEFKDVRSRMNFAPTYAGLKSLIEDVTPIVAKFPQTWRRVLWGEYSATLAELKEAA